MSVILLLMPRPAQHMHKCTVKLRGDLNGCRDPAPTSLALYQSMMRPTKGEMSAAPASAQAAAWHTVETSIVSIHA